MSANAVLFASFALTWSGARVFDRRSAEPVWCMVGVIIWLLACRLPQFAASMELRAMVGAMIVTTYTWLAAYEFWRGRDEALVSRWPAIFMLFAHGALFLLRTPLGSLLQVSPGNAFANSAWLELLSLEALLFTISIAFILLAMAKERTEYRHREAARTDALTGIAQPARLPRAERRIEPLGDGSAAHRGDADRPRQLQGHQRPLRPRDRRPRAADLRRNRGVNIPVPGLIGRWGGDEFAAVLYDTSREDAKAAAERMQLAFQKTDGRHRRPARSTRRCRSAWCSAREGPLDLPALLVQADEALYLAKELGRNRIEVASPETVWKSSRGRRQRSEPVPFREQAAVGGLETAARAARSLRAVSRPPCSLRLPASDEHVALIVAGHLGIRHRVQLAGDAASTSFRSARRRGIGM